MPQHRETSSSVAVAELLRTGADDAPKHHHARHRAGSRTAYRLKLAAGGAVATGALVGSATQFAHAAPILVGSPDAGRAQAGAAAVVTTDVDQQLRQAAAPAPAVPLAESAPVPAPMPVPAPFAALRLPPEVAGALAQAESVLESLTTPQAIRPVSGPQAWGEPHVHLEIRDANDNKTDPEPYLASKGVVLTQQWGSAQ